MTAHTFDAVRLSPFYKPEHEAFRQSLRRFVQREIEPYANDWDEAGAFPRELYKKAAAVGYMGLGFPEAYGGTEGDRFMRIIAMQEVARAGCGGVMAGLFTPHHRRSADPAPRLRSDEGARPAADPLGREDLRARDHRAVGRLRCRQPAHDRAARRRSFRRQRLEDLHQLGHARRLHHRLPREPADPARAGSACILIEGQPDGLQRIPLKKMGWWCSDTATLYFENVRVPAENLIGKEGEGFRAIMLNFNDERLHGAAGSISSAQICLEEAIGYAKERVTFGKPIVEHQVIRHKLVDMAMRIEASQAMLELLTWRLEQGENPVAEICMLKNQATTTFAFCASEAVQIFGGAGFMRGVKVERIYREVKVAAIGAGTEEIMKDLASRQMGL